MMTFNLTNLKTVLNNKLVILAIIVGVVLSSVLIFKFIFLPILRPQIPPVKKFEYTPIQNQPVIDGKFDEKAPVSQKSKTSIEKLLPKLPYRQTIETTTQQKVTFAVFGDSKDLYTLYVEIDGINFQSTYSDPKLPQNVQNFRELASYIFDWLKKQGVSSNEVFISWGSLSYVQKSAEAWLNVSPQYPRIIKSGNDFIFETEPVKNP